MNIFQKARVGMAVLAAFGLVVGVSAQGPTTPIATASAMGPVMKP